jgi:hypothetical protein
MLEILANPDEEEHEEIMAWRGDEFDPEAFDLEVLNAELGEFQWNGQSRKTRK